jgi:hypothetical protein
MEADRFDAGTFAVTGGAIALLMTYLSGDHHLAAAASIPLTVGGVCLSASLIVGLVSSFSQANLERLVARWSRRALDTGALRFAEQVAGYAPRPTEAASPNAGGQRFEPTRPALAEGQIALLKPRLFTAAVALFGLGVLVAAVGVLIQSLA